MEFNEFGDQGGDGRGSNPTVETIIGFHPLSFRGNFFTLRQGIKQGKTAGVNP
jgi:hypothetical protein